MKESFELVAQFPTTSKNLYDMWLSSEGHENLTGGEANCSAKENENFTAWDGYITGKNISLEDGQKIVQSWRTTEFAEDDEDSILKIQLEDDGNGCRLILTHSNIPEGETQYKQGWTDHYFNPMKDYFNL